MTLVCVPLVAPTVEKMAADAVAAAAAGGDLVEIRLDFIQGFCPREHLPRLLRGCPLPALITYRSRTNLIASCLVIYQGSVNLLFLHIIMNTLHPVRTLQILCLEYKQSELT
jgi:hypothetical protein